VIAALYSIASLLSEKEPPRDAKGQVTTASKFWPERAEIIYGGIAAVLIFSLLYKFAGPVVKKALAARTAKVQAELDGAAAATASADAAAQQIRQAKGDIGAQRERLIAEAKVQAEELLTEGRARLETEVADMRTRAVAEIAASKSRNADELRAEISRLSAAAVDHVVTGSLDDATHQDLIERFITTVGAQSAPSKGARV
jgi:F-type H+-transporting ATPase subunit b